MCSLRDEDRAWGGGGRQESAVERALDQESQSPAHLSPAGGLWASVSPPVDGAGSRRP